VKLTANLRFALTGWVAGVAATLGLGLLWPRLMPAFVNVEHYYGAGPGLVTILAIVLLLASPGAAVGGLVGSRVPREGGRTEQQVAAAIAGILLAMPFACYGLWFFTGW
jgi:hypothetical protein